jgi:hypothetical protein
MLRLPPAHGVRDRFRDTGALLVPHALDTAAASELAFRALSLAGRTGRHIRRSSDAGLLDYAVVTGDTIKADGPELYALYESVELLDWLRDVTEIAGVGRSPNLRSAVNINILGSKGQQYRWHTDAVPFTVLLFLTTVAPESGGELLVRIGPDEVTAIPPAAGQLVLMDGHRCPHAVAPLLDDVTRISMPMVFPAVPMDRPDGLDDYLYAT